MLKRTNSMTGINKCIKVYIEQRKKKVCMDIYKQVVIRICMPYII